MFRIGGSAGTGITTGLSKPRQGYNKAGKVETIMPGYKLDEGTLKQYYFDNFDQLKTQYPTFETYFNSMTAQFGQGRDDDYYRKGELYETDVNPNQLRADQMPKDYETGEHWTDTSNVGEKLSSIENNVINNMKTGNEGMPPSDFEMMKAQLGDMPTPSKYPYKASDFFMGLGANILAQPGGQPIFQTIGKAARGPIDQLSKTQQSDWALGEKGKLEQWKSDKDLLLAAHKNTSEDEKNKLWAEANAMFDRGGENPYTKQPFKTPQEAYNLLLKQKFMSKEKVYTPEAQYNDSVNKYENKHLNNMNFKGNSVAARNLATHEANIVHGKYPEELQDQFNLTQLWIDPTFFNTETMQLNEIGDVIPGIETGKVYLNTADGKMYKLGPDKVFIEVSLTDLQG
jgi:hypothetical protein